MIVDICLSVNNVLINSIKKINNVIDSKKLILKQIDRISELCSRVTLRTIKDPNPNIVISKKI